MAFKYLFTALLTLSIKLLNAAPAIEIIRFNNTATYYPGGSISIHIRPTGVFDINNKFYLDLSDANGNFAASPNIIATVDEFFTPIINATIPANTPIGTGYKLRVRSTTAATTSDLTLSFSITSVPTPALQAPEIDIIGVPQTYCLANTNNPVFLGWLNQSTGNKTSERTFTIQNYSNSETYTATIVDLFTSSNPTIFTVPITSGSFKFPANKTTGYYVIELERKKGSQSTVKSFVFQFNTGNTNLGNSSNETVCIDSIVYFTIDTENIKYNYPLSKYTINYGDGSPLETFTHAQLMESPSLSHVYKSSTCSSNKSTQNGTNGYFFKIDLKLYNKGLQDNCTQFTENGNGTTKWANASKPPTADFTTSNFICKNSSISATNTSTPGEYGTKTTCESGMFTTWKVKKPGQSDFEIVTTATGRGKLNLSIAASDVNETGCWILRLEVTNLDGCQTISIKEKTVGVEPKPEPKFKIIKNGLEVSAICNDETVTLSDESNLIGLQCQNPTYSWSITPTTGFSYINGTSSSSQNPQIKFSQPGSYTITQQIKNSCGTFSVNKTLTVNGAPTVIVPSSLNPICKLSPADTILDFSLSPYKPTYSSGAYAPTSYSWDVDGTSNPNDDWEFVSPTSANSDFPKIKLKKYKSYNITVKVNGGCGNGTGSYSITLKQSPKITNSNLEQVICSGAESQTITLANDMSNTTYTWKTTITATGSVSGVTTATSGSNIAGGTLTNTTASAGVVNFAVTAANNGCSSVQDFKISVYPKPTAPTTSALSLCQNITAVALTATSTSGNNLIWYTSATGGSGTSTAPTPSTTNTGSTTYYVSQASNTSPNCESDRSSLSVTIYPVPAINATASNSTNCSSPNGSITITGLVSNSTYEVSYKVNNGAAIKGNYNTGTGTSITLNNLASGEYSDIKVTLNGCPSNAVGPLTISNPLSPIGNKASGNGPLCSGSTINLTGSSETANASFSWTGPNGFTSTLQSPSITNATDAASGNYNLTVSINGCAAAAVSTEVKVRKTPDAPTVTTPKELCQGVTTSALTATAASGNSLKWYDASTGGTASTTAPTPSTSSTGTISYFVSQITNDDPIACESNRAEIKVIIKPTPNISATYTDPTNCPNPDGTITIKDLTPTTDYTVQYTNPSGNNISLNAKSTLTGTIIIDKLSAGEYKNITVTLNGCISNVVGPFTLTNPSSPANVVITSNAPICTGQTLTMTATSSTPGTTFKWTGPGFTGTVSGASQTIQDAKSTYSGIYSVIATVVGCNSEPVIANLIIYLTPPPPAVISPVSYCQNDAATAITATGDAGNTFTWYTQPSGGSGQSNIIPGTAVLGSTTYYVEQSTPTNPPCVSPRTPVIVNVYEIPSISGSFTDPTNCINPDGTITIKGILPNTQYSVAYTFNGNLKVSLITSDGSGQIILKSLLAGTYADITVKLNGCTSNPLRYILTNPAAPSNTTISSNAPICSGEKLTLEASSTTAGAIFSWTGPAFSSSTTGASFTFDKTPASFSGTYTVIASIYGCPAPPVTKNIVVHPTPAAPVSKSPVEYCNNDTPVPLTATVTSNNTLIWYSPSAYSPETVAPTPSTATVGSTFYYVTQISPTVPACESERTKIEVKIKPIPQISVSVVAPTTCNSYDGVMTLTGLFPNTNYQVNFTVNSVIVNTTVKTDAAGIIVVNNLVGGIYKTIFVILNGCRSNVVEGPFNLVNPDVPSTPEASSNSAICEGSALKLYATSLTPNATYSWTGPMSFNSTLQNPEILNTTISKAGRYKVVARAKGCISDTGYVDVVIHPNPVVNLGPDLQLLPPAKQILNPSISNGPISQYTWTPLQNLSCTNCATPTVTVLNTTLYKLVVKNVNGCIGSDEILITALCEKSLIYIPNAFTPEGAGNNAIFRIRSASNLTVKHFRIFNKWGELIFERNNFPINDPSYGWDGRINGKIVNPEVFVYTVEVQCENGSTFFYKGNVTLLR